MYIPTAFEVTDKEEIFSFIRANPFGQLISSVQERLFSSHLPFSLIDDGKTIICHVAKNNPQWEDISNQEVLITFQGEHDYISPTWYSSPGVPTWNYQSVHIYGVAEVITEKEKLQTIVDNLTKENESSFEKPWKPEYREELLSMIVGIEIKISEVQCKYKNSQNKSLKDQGEVKKQLSKIKKVITNKVRS